MWRYDFAMLARANRSKMSAIQDTLHRRIECQIAFIDRPVLFDIGSDRLDRAAWPDHGADALIDRGVSVLVPIVPDGDPAPLDWVRYDGATTLQPGRWGLLEPTGTRLGTAAIRAASVILVPALAIDKSGVRLGRGAGYYDRTLHGLSADLVGVVYDDEVVDSLPSGDHDVPVGWTLTPGDGFRRLG